VILNDILVSGGFRRSLWAPRGSKITVIDVDAQQTGDFVAIAEDDVTEGSSDIETRRALLSLCIKTGDLLYSSRGRPMLKVLEDTIGVHDYTVPACDASRYEVDFGIPGHRNCLENMRAALEHHGVGILEVPDPFSLFQNSPATADARTGFVDAPSRPGGRITLVALRDLICALPPFPQDIIPGNGLAPSGR